MRQATPQAALYGEINTEDRLHDFLLTSFVASFRRAHPPVFIDEVGPNSIFYHDRRLYGYDAFPAMREEVESGYDLVADTEQVRVYVRKDRRRGLINGRLKKGVSRVSANLP